MYKGRIKCLHVKKKTVTKKPKQQKKTNVIREVITILYRMLLRTEIK